MRPSASPSIQWITATPAIQNANDLNISTNKPSILKAKNALSDRLFTYDLDEKATKAKLIKGAKRNPFEIVEKKTCVVINNSDGTFQNVTKPTLDTWENCHKLNKKFEYESHEVTVNSFEKGFDK